MKRREEEKEREKGDHMLGLRREKIKPTPMPPIQQNHMVKRIKRVTLKINKMATLSKKKIEN